LVGELLLPPPSALLREERSVVGLLREERSVVGLVKLREERSVVGLLREERSVVGLVRLLQGQQHASVQQLLPPLLLLLV
jgi:hypothetical protein